MIKKALFLCYNCITFVLQLCYRCVTIVLQSCYKCVTNVLQMKAKKTTPKSIRFNIENLELGLFKSKLQTPQELVDYLLGSYCDSGSELEVKEIVGASIEKKETPLVGKPEKELSKADLFKLMRGKL